MKKARIMLMAVGTFAIVGGALAFKAKNFTNHSFYSYTTTNLGQGQTAGCFGLVQTPLTTVAAPAGVITTLNAVTKLTTTSTGCSARVISTGE